MNSASDFQPQLNHQMGNCMGGSSREPDEVQDENLTEDEFDQRARDAVSVIGVTTSFLANSGCDVVHLVASHLDKLMSILESMQRRNHPRSETVSLALSLLLDRLESWGSPYCVLKWFFKDCNPDYFLRHANSCRQNVIPGGPQRLPDLLLILLLLEQELDSNSLSLLKTVLKYGVSTDQTNRSSVFWDPKFLGCVCTEAACRFSFKLSNYKRDETPEAVLQMGRLLRDAVPPVPFRLVRPYLPLEDPATREDLFCDFLGEMVGRTVPSLKQMCRKWIRGRLHANWALPEGIECLDLPQHVKAYLDLKT